MAAIRPKILLRYGRQNEPIRVPISDLLIDAPQTFLTTDTASAVSALSVENTTGFAGGTNTFAVIGIPGNGSTELKTEGGLSGLGTINLGSSTGFPHSASTPVYETTYNQVEITWAATPTGVTNVLAVIPIVPNAVTTNYNDTVKTSGYYFARFKNSVTGVYSPFSDPAPYGSYTILSARTVIDKALHAINKDTSEVLSDETAFEELDNFQEEVLKEQKRWSFMQSFNTPIGSTATGTWTVPVPSDMDDNFTNKSIWHFRIGKQPDMTFVDKDKWDELTSFVAHTTLAAILNVGDATATLTSSEDFDDAGTLQIGAYTYDYTANNRGTGVITLTSIVPASQNQASGTDVFEGASLGEPIYWTIWQGNIYHFPVTSSDFNQRNYYLDYYKKQTQITKDSDLLVIPDSTCAQYYLQCKFLKKLANGQETPDSTAANTQYMNRREKLKQKESIGRTFRLKPRVNKLYGGRSIFGNDDPEWIRDGNFPNI